MNLTATTHSLELVTAAATAVVYEVSWTDIDKSGASTVATPGSEHGSVSSATDTTIVAAPSADIYRVVTSLSVKATGGAQTVALQKDVSGTEYPVTQAVLSTNESLHYEDAHGWYTLDANGARKTSGSPGADGTDGGGTVLGSGTSEVDFGSGAVMATVTVTGQTAILSGSLVQCWITPIATTDHSAQEHLVEDIKVMASDIVAGTGFTIWAFSPDRPLPPDRDPLSLLGRQTGTGAATGAGQADRDAYRPVPGRAPLLTGKWTVAWMYTQ